ncbi:PREDICTED: coiled-coil domain-containing protein 115-like isoform X2 [Brassica oleracea var. oleracea]|uniref:coiled-coil domain-containing protein 115-like isoform X2 n=1 Tax=Brassica oleracea var. oleracea TaxID=109376 RepID=UPI0006A70495|nr:PREDICTED: coiled-coil domain-containing protein 115-like isoform X2 [Brassica oleracea var. oleracea]
MAGAEEIEICEEGEESIEAEAKTERGDEKVLQFLDSLDGYLTLMDSLNSKLREGWFDLASARHSMGTLRINTTLLDLKDHSASSTLQVTDQEVDESLGSVPRFALSKWASKGGSGKGKDFSTVADSEMGSPRSPQLRHRGVSEKPSAKGETVLAAEIKKERAKSLSVFGGLVSPKLRGAQLSFETALETLVEIANTRAAMLTAFERITKK